tara:strand:- start:605 stop:1120 length:516 start_codon:yes stop_codon:yes gene_type:complete
VNKQQVKELALANGFKLKQQPSGEMDLNPYVYEFVDAFLAKANERVAELEQNQLPIENGKNRYGLDVSYFRNVINRELNRSLENHKPDELARVFARLSRTADKSVMFEPEFSNKFAIEKKIEAIKLALDGERFELDGRPLDFGIRVESLELMLRDFEIGLNSMPIRKGGES